MVPGTQKHRVSNKKPGGKWFLGWLMAAVTSGRALGRFSAVPVVFPPHSHRTALEALVSTSGSITLQYSRG